MTNPTDPITLTREIVGQLVLFLEDFGQTSAANDAGLSTSNLVRNLRSLLAEPKPEPVVAANENYQLVDATPPRDGDGAIDALTRHGITPKPPLADAGGGGFEDWYDITIPNPPSDGGLMYHWCEEAWNEADRRSKSEIARLRKAVSVLGRRVYVSAQTAHTVLGKFGETWEHFIPEDVLANPIASAAVRKAKEQP